MPQQKKITTVSVTVSAAVLLACAALSHAQAQQTQQAYPATLSTDVLFLGARIRAAHAKGTLDRLEISPP